MSNRGRPRQHTADEVSEALKKCQGYISRAAVLLGCDQRSVRRYIERYESCKEALVESRCRQVDVAELALQAAVARGEAWAVALTLRTIGKERGYTERHEVEHSGGITIVIGEKDAAL